MRANIYERAQNIKNKITKRGTPNPRFVKALREIKDQKMLMKDLVGQYHIFTKAQIAAEYTEARVERLVDAAQRNLRSMTAPSLRAWWMPEE